MLGLRIYLVPFSGYNELYVESRKFPPSYLSFEKLYATCWMNWNYSMQWSHPASFTTIFGIRKLRIPSPWSIMRRCLRACWRLAVLTEHRLVTDRRTDGQRDMGSNSVIPRRVARWKRCSCYRRLIIRSYMQPVEWIETIPCSDPYSDPCTQSSPTLRRVATPPPWEPTGHC